MDEKSVKKLADYAVSVGLIYIVIGLLSGFYLVYLTMQGGEIPSLVGSAHSHFLCMSILIIIVGLLMHKWSEEIKEKKVTLTTGKLRSAQTSVFLIALGAILTFVFLSAQMAKAAVIGYILYFIGLLTIAFGYVIGSKESR